MKSSKLNILSEELLHDLKNNNDFFKLKYIFVPSKKLESYFKSYFLKNNNNVLMNVSFVNGKNGLFDLFQNKNNYKMANNIIIRNLIIKYLSLNKILELENYLNDNDNKIVGNKIFDISNSLSKLFCEYENDLFIENELFKSNYQSKIYEYVINELHKNGFTTLADLNKNDELKNNLDLYLFGYTKFSNLENDILSKIDNKRVYILENDINNKFKANKIVSAPSKLREIEALHSEICNILDVDKNAKFSDFLVVSGDLANYEIEIERVFNETDEAFPNIPYYFNSSSSTNNSSNQLINKLFEIGKKGFFTRLDFIDIADNWLTRNIRSIDDNDINNWQRAISSLNIYRNEDWNYLKKRLLISKFSDINDSIDLVSLKDGNVLPFTLIGFDDNSIVKIIKLVDDLFKFIELFKIEIINDSSDLNNINNELSKWLSIKEYGMEKNSYYSKISNLINFWDKNDIHSYLYSLFISIIEITNQPRMKKGSLYSSGISFTTFDINSILSSKYLFFIGGSSANLPKSKSKDALDLRLDDIKYDDERNAFKLYCNNAEEIYYSFINKNPNTNEVEFFISSYAKEFLEGYKEINVPLDESREWNLISTNRGFRNKEFREELLESNNSLNEVEIKHNEVLINNNISTSKIGNYLTDPLKCRVEMLFGSSFKEEIVEYEPFDLDNLDSSNLFKRIAISRINNDDTDLFERLILENKLPNIDINVAKKRYDDILKSVDDYISELNLIGKPEILIINDIKIDNWVLEDSSPVVKIIDPDDKYYYFPIKKLDKISIRDIFVSYAVMLMDTYHEKDSRTIIIKRKSKQIEFELTDAIAYAYLKNIFKSMNNNDFKYLSTDLLKNDNNDIDLYELFNKSKIDWAHWNLSSLFDYKELGYDKNIERELEKKKEEHLKLFAFDVKEIL